jgi:hypothetical protein
LLPKFFFFLIGILFVLNVFTLNSQVPIQKTKDGIQTGSISGQVFKPDLKACPEADVKVKLGKGINLQAKTDKKGMYLFSGVPAGICGDTGICGTGARGCRATCSGRRSCPAVAYPSSQRMGSV